MSNECIECGNNANLDAINKERINERLRQYRRALYLACNKDKGRVKYLLNQALDGVMPSEQKPIEQGDLINTQKFQDGFVGIIEQDAGAAFQLITGMFVGLAVFLCSAEPEDDREIKIEGNDKQRAITIHGIGA